MRYRTIVVNSNITPKMFFSSFPSASNFGKAKGSWKQTVQTSSGAKVKSQKKEIVPPVWLNKPFPLLKKNITRLVKKYFPIRR